MARSGRQESSSETCARLEPRVVHVSEATVRKKWRKLPVANHSAIRELILSAEEQSRQRKGRHGIDLATGTSVRNLVTHLSDTLARMPYPMGTEEHFFDHEANLHRVVRVEEQLSSNLHAMKLLQAQLIKEEQYLKQDEAEVIYLEESVKSNEAVRRQQSRTLHSVARKLLAYAADHNSTNIHEDEEDDHTSALQILFEDNDMLPLLQQLQNHLQSMHSNTSSIQEVKSVVKATGLNLSSSAS